jgi:hypothetical protein
VQNVVKVVQIAGFRCCITKRISLLQKCLHSYKESDGDSGEKWNGNG